MFLKCSFIFRISFSAYKLKLGRLRHRVQTPGYTGYVAVAGGNSQIEVCVDIKTATSAIVHDGELMLPLGVNTVLLR